MAATKGSVAGTSSAKFAVYIDWRRVDSKCTDTQAYIQFRAYVGVTSGNFNGSTFSCSWKSTKQKVYSGSTYLDSGWSFGRYVDYGKTTSLTCTAKFTSSAGKTYTSTCTAKAVGNVYVRAPYAPTGFIAKRGAKEGTADLSWTSKAVVGRPYSNAIITRIAGNNSASDYSGNYNSAKSAIVGGLVVNNKYRFRLTVSNGAGSSSVLSNYIYTTPAKPTAIARGNGDDLSGQKITVKVQSGSPYASNTEIQRSRFGGNSWTTVFSGSYSNTVTFEDKTPGWGEFQYRARNVVSGLYSEWLESGKISNAQPPVTPTSVSAQNIYGGKIYNKGRVTVTAPASTGQNPRDGFGFYVDVIDLSNPLETGHDLHLIDSDYLSESTSIVNQEVDYDISGKCVSFGVDGKKTDSLDSDKVVRSAIKYSDYVYGRLKSPIISVTKDVYKTYIKIDNPNDYPSKITVVCSGDEIETQEVTDITEKSRVIEYDIEDMALNDFSIVAFCEPIEDKCLNIDSENIELYRSEDTEVLVYKSPAQVKNVHAEHDEYAPITVHVSWDAISTEPTLYRIEKIVDGVKTVIGSVEADGSSQYVFEAEIKEYDEIAINVVAVIDYDDYSYDGAPGTVTYKYIAPKLVPPELLSYEEVKPGEYRIKFNPSYNGYPIDVIEKEHPDPLPEGQSIADYYSYAYKYVAYVNNFPVRQQIPDRSELVYTNRDTQGVIGEESITISVEQPGEVSVRLVSVDEFNTSRFSNQLVIKQDTVGIGLSIYSCPSIEIDDCIIDNVSIPLKIDAGSSVSIENSTIILPDGALSYYHVDKRSSIFEVNNMYK